MPHAENGFLHAKLQLPSRQTPRPLAGALQVAPQPSQLLALVSGSTHAPAQTISFDWQLWSPGVVLVWLAPLRTHSLVETSQT